ncbi:MAG: beta-ketoacyl-ACP synthase II [Candidatus Marinimicrobia bacterium]|nr:beta-ketoacyl-ACP synthase II [Candidatus Neomarinimicrobiota bacterium]
MRRVVITGMGALTPIGNNVDEFEAGLFSGRNGIGPITQFDASDFSTKLAGEVKDFDAEQYLDSRDIRKMDPFTIFAMVAAEQALKQSDILGNANPDRIGVIIGSGIGGIQSFEDQAARMAKGGNRKVSPFFVPMMISNIAAGQISMKWGLKGPNYCVVSACATASHAIGDAFRMVVYGDADAIVTGGTEAALSPIAVAGFTNMRALSKSPDPETACRPFDANRDGFTMSEGSGTLVLEELEHARARGAAILGEIVGYGATADAYHITAPSEGGEGAVRAMRRAMEDAGIVPEEVGHINAHGTSTPRNDMTETTAIRTAFGAHADKLIVTSTKSMTGHLLGAAGSVEAIATLLSLRRQETPPTIHYETPDPACDLNYSPNKPTRHAFEFALSNTFGFGGHNAVLALKRYTE